VSLQPLAQQVLDQLERRTKLGEDTYIALKVGAPEWMTEFVQDAHGDFLPDDYRYEFIEDALLAIVGHDDLDEARDSLEPDIYTGKLTAWLASNLARGTYIDEVLEDGGANNMHNLLSIGQLNEKCETFDLVVEALQKLQKLVGDTDGSET
jgi:hypothetical protein